MGDPVHLVAILHSLPVGSGERTKSRIEIARRALSCSSATVANLYPTQLADVNAIGNSGEKVWALGREEIYREISRSDTTDILLGFGVQEPSGDARRRFRLQLQWLGNALESTDARVWVYGDRPTHPSRWQRVAHRHSVGGGVEALAPALLSAYSLGAREG
jgi:hypothetical protein